MTDELNVTADDDSCSALLARVENIVAQWRRKMWTDQQALGNIENAILKHNVAKTARQRDGR
jgi:hypothetical protein